MTPGYGDPCHGCDAPYDPEEIESGRFDVYLSNDVITRVIWFDGRHDYQRDGVESPNTEFIVLDDQGTRSVAARNDPSM